jgi:hypothetical protein
MITRQFRLDRALEPSRAKPQPEGFARNFDMLLTRL